MKTTLRPKFTATFFIARALSRSSLVITFILILLNAQVLKATDVGGPIASNTTWTAANSPYVFTSDVTVNAGIILTIEPGVQVEIPNLGYDLIVNGTMSAVGTVADTIKFLGIGGNGGGSVQITGMSTGSSFDFVLFDRLGISGSSAHDCALRLDAEATVANCTFTNNSDDVRALSTAVAGFAGNNAVNDINLYSGSLTATAIWPKAGSGAHYNLFGDQTLPAGEVLTIMPGVEVRFPNLGYDLNINGQIVAVGTASDTVKFRGIGANGGGSVVIGSTSIGSTFDYALFDKLGISGSSAYDCALKLDAEASISHCTFINNTDDVRALATAVAGFQGTNSVLDINLYANSLSTSATWPKAGTGTVYYNFLGDQTLPAGEVLTIMPGVEVWFPNLDYDLNINGQIVAVGTLSDTIKFRGIGANGGGSVYIGSASTGSSFDYSLFDKLGTSGSSAHDCALRLDAEATIDHCTFTNNTDDVRAFSTAVAGFQGTNFLEDINLYSESLTSTAVWPKASQENYYYNFLGDQTLPVGETLTIMPGANIRLPNLGYDLIINGQLLALGSPSDTIKFFGFGGFDGGSVAILSPSIGSEMSYVRFDSLGTSGSSAFDCALYLETEASVSHCTFGGNTDDVRGRATAFGGFANNNNLEDINVLTLTLDTTAVWPDADAGGFYYNLYGDQSLQSEDTLTIMPGVDVQFNNLSYDLLINGTLIANGTAVDSIRFLGIGTFGGGSVAILAGSSGSTISYARFDRLGINGSSAFDSGLYLLDVATVGNCQFTNNTNDVIADADKVSGFLSTNSLFEINLLSNSLDTNSVWPNADAGGFNYNLLGDQTCGAGDTLTIMPGVDVQFRALDRDLLINGTLIANGTPTDSIRFLGIGTFGGGSVAILAGSSGSTISYARFDRMGINGSSAFDSGLYLLDVATVGNCQFTNNTNDVIADADKVGGFLSTNSLFEINLLSNSLDTNSVWPNADADGFYYNLLGDLTAGPGDTLTINSDVEVQFSNLAFDLQIQGTFYVDGLSGAEVRFIGIGVNGGGSVAIQNMSVGSVISYGHFENLGVNGASAFDAALFLDAHADINNSVFVNNTNDVRADADDVGGFQNNNSLEDINLFSNSLSTTSTWPNADTGGFYYNLEGDMTVPSGVILTIEPGTETQFNNLAFDLLIDGTLIANGTALEPVRFISLDGSGGGSIAIRAGSTGSSLSYCHIENLGSNGASAFDSGVYLIEAASISNCTFVNNGFDIQGRGDAMDGLTSSNSLEDIQLLPFSIGKTSVWPNADAGGFFYRMASDQTISAVDTLTIEPGVSVDFSNLAYDLLVSGTLIASGTDLQPITLYSSAGSGGGSIALLDGSTGNYLHKVVVDRLGENTGSAYDSGFFVQTADAIIKRCNIKNAFYGVTIDYTIPLTGLLVANPVLLKNIIETNDHTGIRVLNGAPVVQLNSIINNTNFGLTNTLANVQVDACDNWWGDTSGPFNASTNPGGLGNAVSDNVLYLNCWLTTPPDAFLAVELVEFYATPDGRQVILDWSTASEIGHDYFDVEKSADGLVFEHLAKVEGLELESGTAFYQVTDQNPYVGKNYYRLKMVDENGFFKYSHIEVVIIENWMINPVEVFPNPFFDHLEIYIDKSITSDESVDLYIYDALGRLITAQNHENVQSRIIVHGLLNLASGTYFIFIKTEHDIISKKVVKR